jgi:hypothetical protein
MAGALGPVYASEDPRLVPRHMAGEQEMAKGLPRTTLRCRRRREFVGDAQLDRNRPLAARSQARQRSPTSPETSPAFVIPPPVQKRAPFLHATAVGWSMPLPRF